MERIVGMRLAYEVCRYCGKKFCYNDCKPEQRSGALDEKRKHESVCPVRFGLEECPQGWAETLASAKKEIENSQRIIDELTEGLSTGSILPLLRESAKKIIREEEENIKAHKRFLGEDPDIEEITEMLARLNMKKQKD